MSAPAPIAAPPASTEGRLPLIVLAGPPNCGKSTLFNRLTGLRQRVANYPGVTVEKRESVLQFGGRQVRLMDLPGSYSLHSGGPDERVAIDVLMGRMGPKPDLVVSIAEISRPEKCLHLAWQIARFEVPQVIVLNFADEARRRGFEPDARALEQELGCPVVVTTGTKKLGIRGLREAIERGLSDPARLAPPQLPAVIDEAAADLSLAVEQATGQQISPPESLRALLDPGSTLPADLGLPKEEQEAITSPLLEKIRSAGVHPMAIEHMKAASRIEEIRERGHLPPALPRHYHRLDRYLLHPWIGPACFVGIMALIFQAIYTWAAPFMDTIESSSSWLQDAVAPWLEGTPLLQSMVVDGMMAGVEGVIVFLPQIAILYAFIALLEDSGYLSRAAFLVDRLFSWCGLNGKSFIPLLSGFACAIPGVMATRSIETPRARFWTAMAVPLMSCSARLPVYVLVIGVLIEPVYGALVAGLTLFLFHFIGGAVAMVLLWLLQRRPGQRALEPFVMELPPLRWPQLRNVTTRVADRSWVFLKTAGTTILAVSILIWVAASFPQDPAVESAAAAAAQEEINQGIHSDLTEEEKAELVQTQIDSANFENSYLAQAGKAVQPVFAPAGFDWKITVGVLASLPAREVIVGTLGTIYQIAEADEENEGLRDQLRADEWSSGPRAGEPVFTLATGLAVMVFFALCLQCWATVAVLARELGWTPALLALLTMSVMAWVGAVLTYQGVTLLGG